MFNMGNSTKQKNDEKIYLSIDHLKKGNYKLYLTLKNKIIKSVKFNKQED